MVAHCIPTCSKLPQLDPAEIEDVILGCADPRASKGRTWRGSPPFAPACPSPSRAPRSTASARPACRPSRWPRTRSSTKGRRGPGGGVESITASPVTVAPQTVNPWVKEQKPGIYMVMGDTAEVVAKRYGISRQVQDEYALSSQLRTAAPQRGILRRRARPNARHPRHPGQDNRQDRRPRRARCSPRTSATGPTRRSRDCSPRSPISTPRAAREP